MGGSLRPLGISQILFAQKKLFQIRSIFSRYTETTLKSLKLNTQTQQREAVVQGRSLSPYRLRYRNRPNLDKKFA
ncbi:MAG: hypothetical protein LBJ00_07525 [Planctomycetaceae bacterium]|nr:hypothetical protein [Planctomycetaceae bacterium]